MIDQYHIEDTQFELAFEHLSRLQELESDLLNPKFAIWQNEIRARIRAEIDFYNQDLRDCLEVAGDHLEGEELEAIVRNTREVFDFYNLPILTFNQSCLCLN